MGVFLFLSPPVHCGQLLKEAVAGESKFGELIQPYFQKEMAGRPHGPQLPQPCRLGGQRALYGGHQAPGGGAQPGNCGWEMEMGLSCQQRLCICSPAGPLGFQPRPELGGGGVLIGGVIPGDLACFCFSRVYAFHN